MDNNLPGYLDNASTTKVDDRVLKAMLPFFSEFYGNPSSKHKFGLRSNEAVERARQQVALLLKCDPREIIFTSGSTESINLAIKGFIESNIHRGNHIITAKTEHKAVLSTCEYLESKGIEVTYLDVDENGIISLSELRESVKETTTLIVIMYVNNETGAIQPIKEIGEIAKGNDVTFFTDATQAIGKIPVNIHLENINMLCFSGHKINGPKGIGVLYKSFDKEVTPLIHGGNQERGLRSGTLNTPLIVGLGKACELITNEAVNNLKYIEELKVYLLDSIREITAFKILANDVRTVPNIVNLMIPNFNADIFIDKYPSIAVSNGSACNSEIIEESHVVRSMLKGNMIENNYLRISLDKFTSKKHIDYFMKKLNEHLNPNHA